MRTRTKRKPKSEWNTPTLEDVFAQFTVMRHMLFQIHDDRLAALRYESNVFYDMIQILLEDKDGISL